MRDVTMVGVIVNPSFCISFTKSNERFASPSSDAPYTH